MVLKLPTICCCKTIVLEKFFRFDKLFKDDAKERFPMSNKKFQKIVVYTMVAIMLISTFAMGLAMIS